LNGAGGIFMGCTVVDADKAQTEYNRNDEDVTGDIEDEEDDHEGLKKFTKLNNPSKCKPCRARKTKKTAYNDNW
jgi:hypothetical protein